MTPKEAKDWALHAVNREDMGIALDVCKAIVSNDFYIAYPTNSDNEPRFLEHITYGPKPCQGCGEMIQKGGPAWWFPGKQHGLYHPGCKPNLVK